MAARRSPGDVARMGTVSVPLAEIASKFVIEERWS
jgi:hypothetical protein